LIATHEADPDAHLETGESLQSHKASEIIDHLARSIVRDKLEFDRYTIDCDFQSIDSWSISGAVSLTHINQLEVNPVSGIGNFAHALISTSDALEDQANFSHSPVWQARIFVEYPGDAIIHFGMFNEDFVAGIGFEILDSVLYAVWFDADETKHTEELLTISDSVGYVCKFAYDYATTTLTFFVNGALVHTVVVAFEYYVQVFALFYNENETSAGGTLLVSNLHFDADNI
jgi:hypothetical protein